MKIRFDVLKFSSLTKNDIQTIKDMSNMNAAIRHMISCISICRIKNKILEKYGE